MKHDTSTTSLTALLATAMLMAAPATLTAQQNDSTNSLSTRMWQTQMPSADFGAALYLNPAMQSYRYKIGRASCRERV